MSGLETWANGQWEPAEETAREEAIRRAAGRYTLREAAKEIARNGRGDRPDVLRKLKTAWAAGKLVAFRPGSELQCELGDASARLHPDYLEAYWGDLNKWLAENQPRVAWQFPEPDATVPDELRALTGTAQPDEAPATTVHKLQNRNTPMSGRFQASCRLDG